MEVGGWGGGEGCGRKGVREEGVGSKVRRRSCVSGADRDGEIEHEVGEVGGLGGLERLRTSRATDVYKIKDTKFLYSTDLDGEVEHEVRDVVGLGGL